MANRTKRTAEKETKFLDALASTGQVSLAAKVAGIGRMTVYEWREQFEDFRNAWESSRALGTELLEDEAFRRGHAGTLKPVFQSGKLAGHVREYSDTLLIFLLKGAKPEKYRERLDVTGKIENVNVTVRRIR